MKQLIDVGKFYVENRVKNLCQQINTISYLGYTNE